MNPLFDYHTNWHYETATIPELEEAIRQMLEYIKLIPDRHDLVMKELIRIELYRNVIEKKKRLMK